MCYYTSYISEFHYLLSPSENITDIGELDVLLALNTLAFHTEHRRYTVSLLWSIYYIWLLAAGAAAPDTAAAAAAAAAAAHAAHAAHAAAAAAAAAALHALLLSLLLLLY